MYGSIKMIYESDFLELDLFTFILYALAVNLKEEIQIREVFLFVFQMTMFITFTCEAGKTIGHDSDYWVNNACLRIWLRLSLLLVLHFVEWFIYSMPVNPVPSVDDVIFLMYYTCCTLGKKAARCLTFYYFSFLLDNAYSLYTYLFQLSLKHLLKKYTFTEKEKNIRCLFKFVFSIIDISDSRQTVLFVSFT